MLALGYVNFKPVHPMLPYYYIIFDRGWMGMLSTNVRIKSRLKVHVLFVRLLL